MKKQTAVRSDSAVEIQRRVSKEEAKVPMGYELTEEEDVVFRQILSARDEWWDYDLLFCVRLAQLEIATREAWEKAKAAGMVDQAKGRESGELLAFCKLVNQQSQIITKLKLNDRGVDPATLNRRAPLPKFKPGDVANLIKKPA